MYAETPDALVVFPGHPERKRWWRSFRTEHPVTVVHRGRVVETTGIVVRPDDPRWRPFADAYRERWPRAPEPELLVAVEVARAPAAS